MKKLQKGFTLIELMIVVAIIAILAAVAAPKFGQQLIKSKNAKGIQLIGTWRSANALYYSDNTAYATAALGFSDTGLGAHVDAGTKAKTTRPAATPATATITVGYAGGDASGFDDITLTYAVAGNEGSISVSGGAMKNGGTENWENQ